MPPPPGPTPSRLAPLLGAGLAGLACALAGCAKAGGGGAPPPIGTVTVLSATTCPSGPGGLPDTTCMELRVETLSNAAVRCELRVIEPQVPSEGTVVFGSGGDGTDFYTDQPGGSELFTDLIGLGFRIVDRRWLTGWFTTETSVKDQSARYATLLAWVRDNLHTGGVFCASGNSGGSAEVAYALTTWGADDLIDAAVLTGGPPLSRLDYLCTDPPTAAWATQCAAIVPPGALACGAWECSTPSAPVCAVPPPGATPEELEEDSVLHPLAVLDYPTTLVSVLIGDQDCTGAPAQALLFDAAVTSPTTLQFVPGAEHFLPTTQAGRDAIVMAILGAVPAAAPPEPSWTVRVLLFEDH